MGDNALCASGVPFGVRYKSQEEIDRNLNKPVPPAPGGTGKIPSFAEDAKFNAKGKRGSCLPNTQFELGILMLLCCPVAGVTFGSKFRSQIEVDLALGTLVTLGPGMSQQKCVMLCNMLTCL